MINKTIQEGFEAYKELHRMYNKTLVSYLAGKRV